MAEQPVTFPSADPSALLTLEGLFSAPTPGGAAGPGVVICHPHPLYGGTMQNNVVSALALVLAGLGFGVLRFNFRGIGRSQGQHTKGEGEAFDTEGAVGWLTVQPGCDPARVGLVGYSFGAGVSLTVAGRDPRVVAAAFVALPSQRLPDRVDLDACICPKFFISGELDTVSAAGLEQYVDRLPEPKRLQMLPGVDHFWQGSEGVLSAAVAAFFQETLGPAL
ncbi:MAG: alpha/beta fold hydrolase [Dehalococcoidia bacterium]|nr:alpha/beta fold hydrolase [Dehalococcoidia bacterium]